MADLNVELTARKVVQGTTLDLVVGAFEFVILDEDDNIVSTGTNNAAGVVLFDPIVFDGDTEPGTYIFTVKETNLDGNNWTIDKSVYVVEIEISIDVLNPDNPADDILVDDTTIYLDDEEVDAMVFTNIYDPKDPSEKPLPPVTEKGKTPGTGINYIAALASIGVSLTIGAAVLTYRRRQTA
jgi:hypothetical protein